jgi:MTH538 TIR-like domain (DUF1863)
MNKSKNVFISHYNRDGAHIKRLKMLLGAKGYTLKNSSIEGSRRGKKISDETIKRLLRLRVHWAGTFICLIGPRTHTRPWVNWEIEQAAKKGKRIVGVYVNGASDADLPDNFNIYGDALVGWTGDRIIDAIEGNFDNFENADGSTRGNLWSSQRSTC